MQNGPGLIDGSPERPSEACFGSPAGGATGSPERDIRLTVPASAQNVVLVRHVLGALTEVLRLPPRLAEDIKLAVTEACTNVVRHAYGAKGGRLDVTVGRDERALSVEVADRGRGLRPNPAGDGAGLGLPLMAALSHALVIEPNGDRGSRVRMSFRRGE